MTNDKDFIKNPVEAYEKLEAENEQKQKMIDHQWKLLEQCGVSAGGELKRVSYILENLRKENERLKQTIYGNSSTVQPITCVADEVYKASIISNAIYKKVLQEIKGLLQSTLDEFEEDDIEQQLVFCNHITKQILDKISEVE